MSGHRPGLVFKATISKTINVSIKQSGYVSSQVSTLAKCMTESAVCYFTRAWCLLWRAELFHCTAVSPWASVPCKKASSSLVLWPKQRLLHLRSTVFVAKCIKTSLIHPSNQQRHERKPSIRPYTPCLCACTVYSHVKGQNNLAAFSLFSVSVFPLNSKDEWKSYATETDCITPPLYCVKEAEDDALRTYSKLITSRWCSLFN